MRTLKDFTNDPAFWEYLDNLESRLVACGIDKDDLPGMTGFRLRTVWGTLTGSPRYFSVMCLRSIEHVVRVAEEALNS